MSQLEISSAPLPPSDQRHRPFFKPHYRGTLHSWNSFNSIFIFIKGNFFLVEEETPYESDVWQGTDGDSGRDSTAHSPEGSKASSPNNTRAGKSCI